MGLAGRLREIEVAFEPPQTQKPHLFGVGFLFTAGEPDDYLLSHGQSALSSAWSRFTVLFGMGRGGTDSLWSSGMTGCRAGFRASEANREEAVSDDRTSGSGLCCFWHNTDLNRASCVPYSLREWDARQC
jgi:hypothetical protein